MCMQDALNLKKNSHPFVECTQAISAARAHDNEQQI